ncbi:MAG TPA: MFS transporter [bacterium]|nr:MFS transporter [bacterium]
MTVEMAGHDWTALISARGVRMFGFGFLSVGLALYLSAIGYSSVAIGLLFTVALAGSAVTSTAMSFLVDRWGRRRMLMAAAAAMAVTGVGLATQTSFGVILALAALGGLSPTGQEVGPFQPIEQAILSRSTGAPRVLSYAWYNLAGTLAAAFGALAAGLVPAALEAGGWPPLAAQRAAAWAFAGCGAALAILYTTLSRAVEAPPGAAHRDAGRGLRRSRRIVLGLTGLFAADALAGGLVVQSLVALWFHERFGVDLKSLGMLFFGANLLAAVSYLPAAWLAGRLGLLNTAVFTHLPSNILLAFVPLMPTWPLAATVLLARQALASMDVPTRQAYTMAIVTPGERAAAAGLTNAIRPAATSLAPILSGAALATAASGLPFFLAGGIKAAYDLALWLVFRRVPLESATESTRGVPGK